MDCKILTREELHALVWSKPIQRLSGELGVSDVGLAKICKRHNIPTPGRGYWRKKETGVQTKVIPLRLAPRDSTNRIVFSPGRQVVAKIHDQRPTKTLVSVTVAVGSPVSHPIAHRTEDLLNRGKRDERGILHARRCDCSHLLVSKSTLPRAILVLDAVLRGIEQNGGEVEWHRDGGVRVNVEDRMMTFTVEEVVRKHGHQKTEAEIKKNTADWMLARWDYELTGRLKLQIHRGESEGTRHTWSDGKQQRSENCLTQFVSGFWAVAKALRNAEAKRQRWQREWQEKQRKAEEQRRRHEREKRRGDLLLRAAEERRQATQLREFIIAAARAAALLDQETEMRVVRLLAWAKEYANAIDPLNDLTALLDDFERE